MRWAGVQAAGQEAEKRAQMASGSFTFAFFTDVHIEPEMDAPQGTELAMEIINASDAEFAICGGDHVFDAQGAHKERIIDQYELYMQAEKTLRMPVRHVLGNHDVAGLQTGMSSTMRSTGRQCSSGRSKRRPTIRSCTKA